jgi:uncharacterized RDD family membrane protein YckC
VAADQLVGLSPEGLEITLPLAGAGSRAIAGAIDLAIQAVLILLIAVAFKGSGFGAAIRAVLVFAVLFFLPIFFDVVDGGRGPGKRLVGLRVVTTNGGLIRARTSAVRNLLRVVDFLPFAYLVGGLGVLYTETGQRLGDIAAGTVVTFTPKSRRNRRKRAADARLASATVWTKPAGPATVPGMMSTVEVVHGVSVLAVDASRVSAAEAGLVQSFLHRRPTLPEPARARIAADIADRLRPNVVGIGPDTTNEEFLEIVARVKAARR